MKPPIPQSLTREIFTKEEGKMVALHNTHHIAESVSSYSYLGRRIASSKAIWGSALKVNGEFSYIPSYREWTEDTLGQNKSILDKAGIYGGIYASLFIYNRDNNIFRSFCEFWCSSTNTLHTVNGEISISLWDLYKLGGLPIIEKFYDEVVPCAKELTSRDSKGELYLPASYKYLFAAYHNLKIQQKRSTEITHIDWVKFWYRGQERYSPSTNNKSRKSASSYPSGKIHNRMPSSTTYEACEKLGIVSRL